MVLKMQTQDQFPGLPSPDQTFAVNLQVMLNPVHFPAQAYLASQDPAGVPKYLQLLSQ